MVNGERIVGLVSPPTPEVGLTYTKKCESVLVTAGANPQITKTILEFKNLIYVRYSDHVLYNRSMALVMAPQVRETIGWLVYECDQYITLTWDKDAGPPTLKGGDPKATGLVLLRSDILEFKRLEDFLPLQNNSEWAFNSQGALLKKREYAHLAKGSEKLPKKPRKGE